MEIDNKAYIFYDFSLHNTSSSLIKLVDALSQTGKIVVLIKCSGNLEDGVINAAESITDSVYLNSRWYKINNKTVKEFTDDFIHFINSLGEIYEKMQS